MIKKSIFLAFFLMIGCSTLSRKEIEEAYLNELDSTMIEVYLKGYKKNSNNKKILKSSKEKQEKDKKNDHHNQFQRYILDFQLNQVGI